MAAINHVMLSDAVTNNRFSAEFFDPKYVFKAKDPDVWLPIGRILKKCEYGISISMNTKGDGFPIFRMNELENCFALQPEKFAAIPMSMFDQYRLSENDVLFNRTNSFEFVGRTGIVKDQTDCTFASYLIRLVPDNSLILSEFLTVYLNTQFGIGQIKRRAMRSINQANVSGSEVRKILIPLVDMVEQKHVADLINKSYQLKKESELAYTDAQQLLETELALKELNSERYIGYQAKFSELQLSQRVDAQHYQPQFAKLLEHLSNFPNKRIREIRLFNRRGIQPKYFEDGTHVVINSQHLSNRHINYDGLQKTSEESFKASPEAHVQPGDLLIYTTGAYIGRTNIYLDSLPAFASNHVNVLRLIPTIDHAYMAMVFQSIIGQFQTQQHARGSSQSELYPTDIDKFVVPIIHIEKQQKIGDLLRDSLAKERKSAQLIEQAKSFVEKLIEKKISK